MRTVEDDMRAAAYEAARRAFDSEWGRFDVENMATAIAAAIMAAHGTWMVEQERRAAHRSVVGEMCHATGD